MRGRCVLQALTTECGARRNKKVWSLSANSGTFFNFIVGENFTSRRERRMVGLIWVRLEMLGRCLRIVTACSDAPSSFLLEMAQPHCLPRKSQDSVRGNQTPLHPCKSNQLLSTDPYQRRLWRWSRVGAWATKSTVGLAVNGWRSVRQPALARSRDQGAGAEVASSSGKQRPASQHLRRRQLLASSSASQHHPEPTRPHPPQSAATHSSISITGRRYCFVATKKK